MAGFALLLVTFVLILAGCGGGSVSPSVASLRTTTSPSATTTDANAATSSAGPGGAVAGSGGANSVGLSMAGGSAAVMMRYSSCMRANGEPSFPDPNGQGQIHVSGIDASSPQFQKAQQACQKDLPNEGEPSPAQQQQLRAQAIAMSDCMRAHGVANFPDPKFGNGGASIKLSAGPGGIDPNSPQFQNAQKVCMPAGKQGGTLPSTVGGG